MHGDKLSYQFSKAGVRRVLKSQANATWPIDQNISYAENVFPSFHIKEHLQSTVNFLDKQAFKIMLLVEFLSCQLHFLCVHFTCKQSGFIFIGMGNAQSCSTTCMEFKASLMEQIGFGLLHQQQKSHSACLSSLEELTHLTKTEFGCTEIDGTS